jgi:hypothetical protein
MIQTYYKSLVWCKYVLIIPKTDEMSESYQWLIICLNHTNDWWYVWIIPMTENMSESYQWLQSLVWFRRIISHWYDSDILSVIGMIQTYHQSLVWYRHIISDWHDSDILSVIGRMSESFQWLMKCLNHTNDWWYVLIIPMTDNMS